jgi:BCD family chlorophyll transporter-like MFS transporter
VRVWLGYRSDGYPIFGKRREPYIISGALLTGLGTYFAVLLTLQSGPAAPLLLMTALTVAFVLYGIGRNLGHNTFQALLSDRFVGPSRDRAITLYEVATLLGLVMGAGLLGKALETFDAARLLSITLVVMLVSFVLGIIAALGQEPRSGTTTQATEKAREIPFGQVIRDVVLGDRQVLLFFILVIFTIVGTLAQDVLLEPYGALVLGMNVGDTTRLTSFWGVGVMVSMLASGAFLLRTLGRNTVLRIGLGSSIVAFAGLIVAGSLQNVALFRGLIVVMGLGTGLAGAGMLASLVNFTTMIRAGMLMGVWGVANQLGRAFGSLMGGSVVDLVMRLTGGDALAAYGTVFGLEVAMLAAAFILSLRMNVTESRAGVEMRNQMETSAVQAS